MHEPGHKSKNDADAFYDRNPPRSHHSIYQKIYDRAWLYATSAQSKAKDLLAAYTKDWQQRGDPRRGWGKSHAPKSRTQRRRKWSIPHDRESNNAVSSGGANTIRSQSQSHTVIGTPTPAAVACANNSEGSANIYLEISGCAGLVAQERRNRNRHGGTSQFMTTNSSPTPTAGTRPCPWSNSTTALSISQPKFDRDVLDLIIKQLERSQREHTLDGDEVALVRLAMAALRDLPLTACCEDLGRGDEYELLVERRALLVWQKVRRGLRSESGRSGVVS